MLSKIIVVPQIKWQIKVLEMQIEVQFPHPKKNNNNNQKEYNNRQTEPMQTYFLLKINYFELFC